METRASYLVVGAFVLALIAGGFGFALWISRANLKDDSVYYYIYFKGAVTGLQNGSQVLLRGVPVGTVTDIAIDEKDVEVIQVTVGLKPGTPVKTDTVAQLQMQGITGLSFVQLSGGTTSAPPLEPRLEKRRAVIPSKPSSLERVFESVPEVTAALTELAVRANDLLNDENRKAMGNVFLNLDVLTGALADSREDIRKTLHDAPVLVASLSALSDDLHKTAALLGDDMHKLAGQSGQTAAALTQMAQQFNRLAEDIQVIAGENRGALRDFGQSGLYELTQFLADARLLVATLNRVAGQLERDPARFLFGDQQKGIEAR
jgi:phospholipid/cholesterol/gamma-HCH transport system substrate-binding protein